jgi:hypothetical protein
VNGSLDCGTSCTVVGPDHSSSTIFTPLVISLAAASGIILLVVAYCCIRSCCSSRWEIFCPNLALVKSRVSHVFVVSRKAAPTHVPENRQRLLGSDVVSQPPPLSRQYR